MTLVVNGATEHVLEAVRRQPFVREATGEDGVVRLYVDRGETAVPLLLRVLDGAGLEAPRSPSTGPASTTSSSSRPAARCATKRPDPTRPTKGTLVMKTIRDTWLIFHRSLILTLRQPTWVVFGMMQPVLYLVLFGPLLEGAVKQAGAGTNAFNWFVPGLIIQIAIFGTAFGGFGLIAELRNGVVERMRVTPMSRASMLLGRSLRDVVDPDVPGADHDPRWPSRSG